MNPRFGFSPRTSICPECEAQRMEELHELHQADVLASRDPRNDPTHRDATDAEWWAWVLSGGRD